MEIPKLIAGAEPKFYRGNHVGCLVVHGFMASPAEVGWMGSHLAAQGYTVYVPRLTGHGINPDDMTRMRWQDWYAQVLDGYYLLRQQCEQVYVIGHSMGALLTLMLAASDDTTLDGIIVTAAPMMINSKAVPYARSLSYILPFTHHPSEPELNAQVEAEQAQRAEPITSRVHYAKWSTRALYELHLLVQMAKANLAQVTSPVLLLYAEQDTTVPPANLDIIKAQVSSEIIETHILKSGAHIIFQDSGRDEAFEVVADFIDRQIAQHL